MKQVLVVAHEHAVRTGLGLLLGRLGVAEVIETGSAEPALSALENGVDAAFLSAAMPDQLALYVARNSARFCPNPIVVVVSQGPHPDLFALAQAGARAHLTWPATSEDVARCLNTQRTADGLELGVRSLVGRVGIKDAQEWLRQTMLRHALEASQGSRRQAARLLGVTRPAIQRMLREEPEGTQLAAVAPSASAPPLRRSTLRPLAVPVGSDRNGAKRRRPP